MAMIVGIFVKKIRLLFPPVITGTVVFTIGLSLYPTAINYMAGGTGNTYELVVAQKGLTEALVYGSWQNWARGHLDADRRHAPLQPQGQGHLQAGLHPAGHGRSAMPSPL